MVSNSVMDIVKTGSSKGSQVQKKKTANDKTDFGQALTDAAGAANSANAQAEKQTYEQKDDPVAEKGTESVQAAEGNLDKQPMLNLEGTEGKDALSNFMQMGAESAQTAEEANGLWAQNMAEAAMETGVANEADVLQTADMLQTVQKPVNDLPKESQTENVLTMGSEELAADASIMKKLAEAKGGQTNSDTGEKANLSKSSKEETNVVDVSAQAAADKAETSFMRLQGNSDSGVIEAKVEVAETGEIKPEYANMLKDMIAKQISSGRQEFELSLTPKNLGALIVKVAYEAGETTVSIMCSNAKAMQAMASKAGELGRMLEGTLGEKMDVVVEDKNGQESHFYEEGRNDSGAQAQKEEQERRHEESLRRMGREADSKDFLQQLRLGLA